MSSSLSFLYSPTPVEEAYALYLLRTVFHRDYSATDFSLDGQSAVPFFTLSGQDRLILRNIWSVADPLNVGSLTSISQFHTCLRLIALAQTGILGQALATAFREHASDTSPTKVMVTCLQATASNYGVSLAVFTGIDMPPSSTLQLIYQESRRGRNPPSRSTSSESGHSQMFRNYQQQQNQVDSTQDSERTQHTSNLSRSFNQDELRNMQGTTVDAGMLLGSVSIASDEQLLNQQTFAVLSALGSGQEQVSMSTSVACQQQQGQGQDPFAIAAPQVVAQQNHDDDDDDFGDFASTEPSGWDALDALVDVQDAPLPQLGSFAEPAAAQEEDEQEQSGLEAAEQVGYEASFDSHFLNNEQPRQVALADTESVNHETPAAHDSHDMFGSFKEKQENETIPALPKTVNALDDGDFGDFADHGLPLVQSTTAEEPTMSGWDALDALADTSMQVNSTSAIDKDDGSEEAANMSAEYPIEAPMNEDELDDNFGDFADHSREEPGQPDISSDALSPTSALSGWDALDALADVSMQVNASSTAADEHDLCFQSTTDECPDQGVSQIVSDDDFCDDFGDFADHGKVKPEEVVSPLHNARSTLGESSPADLEADAEIVSNSNASFEESRFFLGSAAVSSSDATNTRTFEQGPVEGLPADLQTHSTFAATAEAATSDNGLLSYIQTPDYAASAFGQTDGNFTSSSTIERTVSMPDSVMLVTPASALLPGSLERASSVPTASIGWNAFDALASVQDDPLPSLESMAITVDVPIKQRTTLTYADVHDSAAFDKNSTTMSPIEPLDGQATEAIDMKEPKYSTASRSNSNDVEGFESANEMPETAAEQFQGQVEAEIGHDLVSCTMANPSDDPFAAFDAFAPAEPSLAPLRAVDVVLEIGGQEAREVMLQEQDFDDDFGEFVDHGPCVEGENSVKQSTDALENDIDDTAASMGPTSTDSASFEMTKPDVTLDEYVSADYGLQVTNSIQSDLKNPINTVSTEFVGFSTENVSSEVTNPDVINGLRPQTDEGEASINSSGTSYDCESKIGVAPVVDSDDADFDVSFGDFDSASPNTARETSADRNDAFLDNRRQADSNFNSSPVDSDDFDASFGDFADFQATAASTPSFTGSIANDEVLDRRDQLISNALELPESLLCREGDAAVDRINFSDCFDGNIGNDQFDNNSLNRIGRSLHLMKLLSSSHVKLASCYWDEAMRVIQDELMTANGMLSEAANLGSEDFASVEGKLEIFVHGLGEFVRISRSIVATIGDLLLLDQAALFTNDTLASSWCSMPLLNKALRVEQLWSSVEKTAQNLGLTNKQDTSHRLESIVKMRSRSDLKDMHLCQFTLRPLKGERTESTVLWEDRNYMACAANFLSNRCPSYAVKT